MINDQWYHIAVVMDEGQTDSTQIRLYINNQLDATALAGSSCVVNTAHTVPVHLGAWNQYSTGTKINYFHGQMDEVKIYSRALSAAEIAALAQ